MTEKQLTQAEEIRNLVNSGNLKYDSALINLTEFCGFSERDAKKFLG